MSLHLEVVAWLGLGFVFARFRVPENVPVERLAMNANAYLQEHPADPRAHYMLARLHYLAFALRTDAVGYLPSEDGPGSIYNGRMPGRAGGKPQDKISPLDAHFHIQLATQHIRKALELDPQNPLHHLTAGCIYEDGHMHPILAVYQPENWQELTIEEYKQAFELSARADSLLARRPVTGFQSLISYEAATSYLRLEHEPRLAQRDLELVAKMQAHVKRLAKLPIGGITPIVFSLEPCHSIDELIDPLAHTHFDLDGTGRGARWPWLKPSTAALVWDPERTGQITSGRQLFGSVTWWMFWDSGYQALAALDNNRDGWLTGDELDGLAVWFDRNQNGVSDPGEVMPIEATGIEALRVTSDAREGDSFRSSTGLLFRNGSTLPTWDWVTSPIGDLTTLPRVHDTGRAIKFSQPGFSLQSLERSEPLISQIPR